MRPRRLSKQLANCCAKVRATNRHRKSPTTIPRKKGLRAALIRPRPTVRAMETGTWARARGEAISAKESARAGSSRRSRSVSAVYPLGPGAAEGRLQRRLDAAAAAAATAASSPQRRADGRPKGRPTSPSTLWSSVQLVFRASLARKRQSAAIRKWWQVLEQSVTPPICHNTEGVPTQASKCSRAKYTQGPVQVPVAEFPRRWQQNGRMSESCCGR